MNRSNVSRALGTGVEFFLLRIAVCTAVGVIALSAHADDICPAEPAYAANTFAGPLNSNNFDMVARSDGSFFVVMRSDALDPLHTDLALRMFGSDGVALAPEVLINDFTGGKNRRPAAAARDDGSFEIVWQEGAYGGEQEIIGRRFDSTGTALGPQFQINGYTTGDQGAPSVAAHSDGSFVVAWSSGNDQDGDGSGVFAQRFDAAGAPVGSEFMVNSHTTGSQGSVDVAMFNDGDFVVAWSSGNDQDGSGSGVFAQMFDASGTPTDTEFQLNSYTTGDQKHPSIATADDGSFVVAWAGRSAFGSTRPFARRFDPAGNADGDTFELMARDVSTASVAMHSDGSFVGASWNYHYGDAVIAQRFDASEIATGPVLFATNVPAEGWNEYATVSTHGDGAFIVAFSQIVCQDETVCSTFTSDIMIRRFEMAPTCPAIPRDDCRNVSRAALDYKEKSPSRAKLKLDWKRFLQPTSLADFGDPVAGDTTYSIRVYNDSSVLLQEFLVDRGSALCGADPCWATQQGKVYRYADGQSSAAGISQIDIVGDSPGAFSARARVRVRGRNKASTGEVDLPTGLATALAGNSAPTIQIVASDGACVSATLSIVRKDTGARFKAILH